MMDLGARLAELRRLAASREPVAATDACPPPEAWDEMLAGMPTAGDTEQLLQHAIHCGHCGPRLRETTEALAPAAGAELDAELATLPSSQPQGRRQLARRLQALVDRGRAIKEPRRRRFRLAWVATALMAAVVVAAMVWGPQAARGYVAERLLAQAYAGHRILPLRFAGAAFGPVLSAERGAPPLPAGLLEAEGLLTDALARRPNDASLLEAQAHAFLIAGNPDAAVADLRRALALHGAKPELHSDLGAAYYEAAETGHAADYGTALDELGQALAKAPRDPIALFNRALVEEALEDWTGAVADWSAYLGVDTEGPWANEARGHLAADQAKVKAHDAAVAAPLLNPAALAGLSTVDAATDARIETYITTATQDWLPAAFPVAGIADPGARAGLKRLGDWLERNHRDRWMDTLLEEAGPHPQPGFSQAVAELSAAITANAQGKPDAARAAARAAEAGFSASAVPAGQARAAYEEVYALQRAEQGTQCEAVLQRLLPESALAGFAWLAGETELERSSCQLLTGRNGSAELARARSIAVAAGYVSLQMRSVAFSGEGTQSPDSDADWLLHRQQLGLYWRAPVGAYRGYQLDMLLAIFSAQRQQWFAAERLARAGVERLTLTPERSYEAMARQALADYAAQCGFASEAQAQATRADALFAALPATPTTADLRSYNDIDLAAIDMETGEPQRAQAELAAYRRDQPPVVSLDARALPYFALEGEIELAAGHEAAAEQDERAAIAICENDRTRLAADEDRLGWQQRNRDAYRAWIALQWQWRRDPVAALEFWEWTRGAAVRNGHPLAPVFLAAAQRFDSAGAPPLPEPSLVRSQLAAMTSVQAVSYLLQPRELDLWLYDNRGIHGVREPVDATALESAAHAFALGCANPDANPELLAAQGRQLYGQLLAPVQPWLDANRTLVVEPDGALAEIPFPALREPDGAYLAQPVLQSPGLAYGQLAGPRLDPANAHGLIVADSGGEPGPDGQPYPLLPEVTGEAADIAATFPGSRVLSGDDVTAAAVLTALPRAGIFHFAGHAEGGRLLVRDGTLGPADFTPARTAQCRLAVLAACATGSGAALFDADGMVRALLRCGVGDVIATRWAVDSAATRQFSQFFYSALRAGQPVPRALDNAQTQLRRQPATAAPFYWAAFAAFGARG